MQGHGDLVIKRFVVEEVYREEEYGVEQPSLEGHGTRLEEEVFGPAGEVEMRGQREECCDQELSECNQRP